MSNDIARCELCGEPMPAGEEMFKYHGYSGPCPKPPTQQPDFNREFNDAVRLANKILDRPSGDPDDDLAVLSRQFLRAIEPKKAPTPSDWKQAKDFSAGSGNPLAPYAKHLTGCGIFDNKACDCGLLKVLG